MSLAVAAVLVATATAACANEVRTDGPLQFGSQESELRNGEIAEPSVLICEVSSDTELRQTVNHTVITNWGDDAVTITDVSLVEPNNMELIEAALFAVPEPTSSGGVALFPSNGVGYPPKGDEGRLWDRRMSAEGAVVEAGAQWSLAVGLSSHTPTASMKRIRVEYIDEDGQRYEIFGWHQVSVIEPGAPHEDCEG